jgi:hypothetical protein
MAPPAACWCWCGSCCCYRCCGKGLATHARAPREPPPPPPLADAHLHAPAWRRVRGLRAGVPWLTLVHTTGLRCWRAAPPVLKAVVTLQLARVCRRAAACCCQPLLLDGVSSESACNCPVRAHEGFEITCGVIVALTAAKATTLVTPDGHTVTASCCEPTFASRDQCEAQHTGTVVLHHIGIVQEVADRATGHTARRLQGFSRKCAFVLAGMAPVACQRSTVASPASMGSNWRAGSHTLQQRGRRTPGEVEQRRRADGCVCG